MLNNAYKNVGIKRLYNYAFLRFWFRAPSYKSYINNLNRIERCAVKLFYLPFKQGL